MRSRIALAAAWGVLACAGCVSGGGDGGTVGSQLTGSFAASGVAGAPALVRLVPGGSSGSMVNVDIVIGGPVDDDLYAFAFDLVLSDPAVARYVPGSARAGEVLGSTESGPPTVLAAQNGNRVVFGISKVGGGGGDGVPGGQQGRIARLTFEVTASDVTELRIDGNPQGRPPLALDPAGSAVDEVRFDRTPGRLAGS